MEGIKEEVVLSPAHALSLIASGEGICFYLEDMLYITQPKFLGQKPLGELIWCMGTHIVLNPRDLSSKHD